MNKVYCDRCGKEIPINNEGSCCILPKYSVTKNMNFPYYNTILDLCPDCEEELDEWFMGENGGHKK